MSRYVYEWVGIYDSIYMRWRIIVYERVYKQEGCVSIYK